jgi:DNA-binding NarL/FixJ family response regulator
MKKMHPTPPATAQSKKISVLLVDDHTVVRQGLRMFIEMQKDMEVIGEGSNGIEAVELSTRLKPDVILLDLLMPAMDGVNATRMIMEHDPHSRVLILTSFGEDDNVFPAIALAQGFYSKTSACRARACHPGPTRVKHHSSGCCPALMTVVSDGITLKESNQPCRPESWMC